MSYTGLELINRWLENRDGHTITNFQIQEQSKNRSFINIDVEGDYLSTSDEKAIEIAMDAFGKKYYADRYITEAVTKVDDFSEELNQLKQEQKHQAADIEAIRKLVLESNAKATGSVNEATVDKDSNHDVDIEIPEDEE